MSEQSKAPDLHGLIMKIPSKPASMIAGSLESYKQGHRDARHDAAELSLGYVSRDHCNALVGAAYEDAADVSADAWDWPQSAGSSRPTYEAIKPRTPADAQAAYDAALSAARAEGYAKGLANTITAEDVKAAILALKDQPND